MDGAKSKFVRGIRTGGHLLGGKWQNMEFVIYGICKLKNEHFHFGDPKGRLPLKPCPVSLNAPFFSGSYGSCCCLHFGSPRSPLQNMCHWISRRSQIWMRTEHPSTFQGFLLVQKHTTFFSRDSR